MSLGLGLGGAFAASDTDWEQLSRNLKTTVVNIELARPIGLSEDRAQFDSGTGFVVDAQLGLVATVQHVTGESPLRRVDLVFSNGEKVVGDLYYYDPWHDFSFIKYDPKQLKFTPKTAEFGSHADLKEGEEVGLIGNASGQGFSFKTGRVNRLFVVKVFNNLWRHSHQIHLSLARAGGASGSPVFNRSGKVIALHTGGRENESFELRIDYVARALRYLQVEKTPPRGDLSLSLYTAPIRKALEYLMYDPVILDQTKKVQPSFQEVLLVGASVPGSVADEKLKQGDIVVGIQGKNQSSMKYIGEDIYEFDRIVDENINGKVQVTVSRDKRLQTFDLPVLDAEQGKLKRFATFAGSVFHEVSPIIALHYGVRPTGIYISESDPGTSFSLGDPVRDTAKKRRMVLTKLGTKKVDTLDDFIRAVSTMKKNDSFTVWGLNLLEIDRRDNFYYIDVDPTFDPLKLFEWNPKTLAWKERNSN